MKQQSASIILVPVYNDWDSFQILVSELGKTAKKLGRELMVLVVDDCSTVEADNSALDPNKFEYISNVQILHLLVNLGHQRAVAIGLSYIQENFPNHSVIIMDADGEDQPVDIEKLFEVHDQHPTKIIFAERTRRQEGFWFQLFYRVYKILFKLLTGKTITFGNYSLIPPGALQKVVHMPEIWNHYAGAILKSKLPITKVPTDRGRRYAGKSKMNFAGLVLHGLSGISIYLEIVIVRMLVATLGVIVAAVIGFLVVVYIKFFTELAIPGWATNLSIGIAVIVSQAIVLLTLLTFLVLSFRSTKQVIPINDYADFIYKTEKVVAFDNE